MKTFVILKSMPHILNITSTKDVMFLLVFVCLSVYVSNYFKLMNPSSVINVQREVK